MAADNVQGLQELQAQGNEAEREEESEGQGQPQTGNMTFALFEEAWRGIACRPSGRLDQSKTSR